MKNQTTNTKLIRVRVYAIDFDGRHTDMTFICYVEKLEDAAKKGWKYEIAE